MIDYDIYKRLNFLGYYDIWNKSPDSGFYEAGSMLEEIINQGYPDINLRRDQILGWVCWADNIKEEDKRFPGRTVKYWSNENDIHFVCPEDAVGSVLIKILEEER
ncbi:MAG: hypothetical protein WC476_00810 [Phycisphaerae bacterium]|jgi:hypothetical protein